MKFLSTVIVIATLRLLLAAYSTNGYAIKPDGWVDNKLHSAQGSIYTNVARIKNPTKSIIRFSPEQVQDIKSRLKPGDILLSFTEGYVGSVFLPGKFKHSLTYIGDLENRQALGIDNESFSSVATSHKHYKKMIQAANSEHIPSGENANMIEAVAEGVRVNSLEKLLATHINRLVVLRPRISQEKKKNQVVGLFTFIDTPYDFRFDFSDASRNCCSELILRTLGPNSPYNFPMTIERRHKVLTADGIANYHLDNPELFEFVLLTEEGKKSGAYNAAVYLGEDGNGRLRKLMSE
jgi:uncharacterized protein YycO